MVLEPLVELVLLTVLSYYTSLWTTILFILVTGLLGIWLAHTQGLSTYRRIQTELDAGRMPTLALLDGVLIFIAGVLMIAPGVLTDILGILLMFPPTRFIFRRWLILWFVKKFKLHKLHPAPKTEDDGVVDSYATDSTPRISDSPQNGEETPGV